MALTRVLLSEDALAALRALPRSSALVFPADADALLAKGQCEWPLWRACARFGIQRIGWYALRHSFASHLVMRGVPMKAVQELLGHCTMEMTMRYAHLSADVRRDAVRLLDVKERIERGYQRGSPVHVLAARERVVSSYRLASGSISARIAA
jgi:integrase